MKRTRGDIILKILIPTFIVLGLLYSIDTRAGQITIPDPEEVELSDGYTLCIYSNSNYSFEVKVKGECKYTRTFNTDDE